MAAAARTLEDLPLFHVSAVKQSGSGKDYFELVGVLNRTTDVAEGRCSLLLASREVLTALPGYLEFRDPTERSACIHTPSKSRPEVVGLDLTYVQPKWDPLHVWMVALPTWKWTRSSFQATDAIAKIVKREDVSIVDGEEVREWIHIREHGRESGLSKYYPVFPSGKTTLPQIEPDGIIRSGWNHAHCELCHGHVDSGSHGYVDPSEHWVCEGCHARYVEMHDLSFMFE
jgi:hypothetical protein